MKDEKKILISTPTTQRTFDYKLGDCTLAFTLRTDIKQQLKDYVTLLERALLEVKEELNGK